MTRGRAPTLGELLRSAGRNVLESARDNVQLTQDRLEAEQILADLVRWARSAGYTEAKRARIVATGTAAGEPYDALLRAERYCQRRRIVL